MPEIGCSPAWEPRERYTHLYEPVLARCRALMGNDHDAEDAAQEVFRRVAERDSNLAAPLGWMLRVAANVCSNELRRRRREDRAMLREGGHLMAAPAPDAAEIIGERGEVSRLLRRLTPAERALLGHRLLYGMTLEATATDLGIAASTARNLLMRSRRKIGEELRRAAWPAIPLLARDEISRPGRRSRCARRPGC